ncbi:hypothetical protein AAHC03_022825 [Spirometra sp. Aus1]
MLTGASVLIVECGRGIGCRGTITAAAAAATTCELMFARACASAQVAEPSTWPARLFTHTHTRGSATVRTWSPPIVGLQDAELWQLFTLPHPAPS